MLERGKAFGIDSSRQSIYISRQNAFDAMTAPSESGDYPGIRTRALTGFVDLVEKLGGDPWAMLAEVGLSGVKLSQPEERIEHVRLLNLLELAARQLRRRDFGLRLAAVQSIDVLGPLALIARNAATVREALQSVALHFAYHNPNTELILYPDHDEQHAAQSHVVHLPPEIARRQNSELSIAVMLHFMQLISRSGPEKWTVWFSHGTGLTPAQYRRHLGCKVLLGQAMDALVFPKALLDAPIISQDPELAQLAQKFIATEMRRYPNNLLKQVQFLVSRQLSSGQCSLQQIAVQLNLSPRTLQRRLAERGADFASVVDGIRKYRANELLTQTQIPLGHLPAMLGYTELSTLNRSCLRWHGQTPGTLREKSTV